MNAPSRVTQLHFARGLAGTGIHTNAQPGNDRPLALTAAQLQQLIGKQVQVALAAAMKKLRAGAVDADDDMLDDDETQAMAANALGPEFESQFSDGFLLAPVNPRQADPVLSRASNTYGRDDLAAGEFVSDFSPGFLLAPGGRR